MAWPHHRGSLRPDKGTGKGKGVMMFSGSALKFFKLYIAVTVAVVIVAMILPTAVSQQLQQNASYRDNDDTEIATESVTAAEGRPIVISSHHGWVTDSDSDTDTDTDTDSDLDTGRNVPCAAISSRYTGAYHCYDHCQWKISNIPYFELGLHSQSVTPVSPQPQPQPQPPIHEHDNVALPCDVADADGHAEPDLKPESGPGLEPEQEQEQEQEQMPEIDLGQVLIGADKDVPHQGNVKSSHNSHNNSEDDDDDYDIEDTDNDSWGVAEYEFMEKPAVLRRLEHMWDNHKQHIDYAMVWLATHRQLLQETAKRLLIRAGHAVSTKCLDSCSCSWMVQNIRFNLNGFRQFSRYKCVDHRILREPPVAESVSEPHVQEPNREKSDDEDRNEDDVMEAQACYELRVNPYRHSERLRAVMDLDTDLDVEAEDLIVVGALRQAIRHIKQKAFQSIVETVAEGPQLQMDKYIDRLQKINQKRLLAYNPLLLAQP